MRVLERALRDLHGGRLEVELPDGSVRSFGSGRPVRLTIVSDNLFQRLALRGKLGLGESYQAGEWHADDLPGFMELLFRNADTAVERRPRLARADERPARGRAVARDCRGRAGTSVTTTTWATTSSS